MSSADVGRLLCPQCGSSNTSLGASGNAMCVDCLAYWDPADPQPVTQPLPAPFAMAPADEIFGPVSDDRGPLERTFDESYTGGTATLEGGQVGEVVSFTDHDTIVVRIGNGDLEEVPLADVLSVLPPVEIPEPVEIPDTVGELPADVLLTVELAELIVRAGCESVHGSGDQVTPGVPPVGYLPDDPALHGVVERAAGMAVGMLIEQFELDVDVILAWCGAVRVSDDQGDPTTEVASGERTDASE